MEGEGGGETTNSQTGRYWRFVCGSTTEGMLSKVESLVNF
jgi:hypothetical protein